MKVKTLITLSEGILKEIDALLVDSGNRSIFIEEAIRAYIERNKKHARNRSDLELINNCAEALNEEAEDVLTFQVDS